MKHEVLFVTQPLEVGENAAAVVPARVVPEETHVTFLLTKKSFIILGRSSQPTSESYLKSYPYSGAPHEHVTRITRSDTFATG